MQSFRTISHINDTELLKYLWTLKVSGTGFHLKWGIKSYASRYKCSTRRCDLCMTEKNNYCSSRPESSIEQKGCANIKISAEEQVYFEQCQIKLFRIDMLIA